MSKELSPTDVKTLRTRARQHIDEGSVTARHTADRRMLEDILAVKEQHADELADLLLALPGAAMESGRAAAAP